MRVLTNLTRAEVEGGLPQRGSKPGPERFEVLPEQAALRAGQTLRGVVRIWTRAPLQIARLWLEVTGRELVSSPARHYPGVYRHPVHRPWGRTHTGAATVDFQQRLALRGELPAANPLARLAGRRDPTGAADDLCPPGIHSLPFSLDLPPDALPTYRGVGVVVEQDVTVHLELAGGRTYHAWAPLHLWQGPTDPPPTAPLVASSADRGKLVKSVTSLWRTPVELELTVPTGHLRLGDTLRVQYRVSNPYQVRLGRLAFELEAREVSRHRAATDDESYRVARLEIRPSGDEPVGELPWRVTDRLVPTLHGHRFKLSWLLRGSVLIPWRLGPVAELPLPMVDPPTALVDDLGEEARS